MPRPYPEEFRRRAVELARLREKPVSQVAAELGIAQSARRWVTMAHREERGQALALMLVTIGLTLVGGVLVIDIGLLFDERRQVQAAARLRRPRRRAGSATQPGGPRSAVACARPGCSARWGAWARPTTTR